MTQPTPMFAMKPVVLEDFLPSAASLELLKTFEAVGLKDVILCGGALRDRYLGLEGKIGDYDMVADFGARIDLFKDRESFPKAMAQYLEETLGKLDDMRISTLSGSGESMGMTLKFKHQGKEVSLSINNTGGPHADWVNGDAPLNSIAMNSAGRVLAHPLFEQHAAEKKYVAFENIPPERAATRQAHLKQKIPGLS